ncbi:MAG: FIST N-terminal domain-containing protein [Thermodesulfobacteriota bacterium]|nr:FIST N-terminal domain-containing protein [Thermodesulfobacteriota bacterium]
MKKITVILMTLLCFLFTLTPIYADSTIKAAVGSSTNSIATDAVAEVLAEVNAENPDFAQNADVCLLLANSDYDCGELLSALNEKVDIPIWGATSSHATMTTDGYEVGGVSMLFLSGRHSPDLKVGVAAAFLGSSRADAVSAGKQAVEQAIKQAVGATIEEVDNHRSRIVLVASAPGMEEAVIEGIESVVGKKIPILGGSAADNTVEGNWKQFANDQVSEHDVVVAVISIRARVGYDFANSYNPTDKTAYIKASSEYGRLVEELDDRPALDVYAEWIGEDPANLEGMNLLGASLLSPVATYVSRGGRGCYVTGHPAIGNNSDGTMFCFKEFPAATPITLMDATIDDLVAGVGNSINTALERAEKVRFSANLTGSVLLPSITVMEDREIAALFLVHCGGMRLAIGDDQMVEVFEETQEIIGNETPFITFFAFGEQGNNRITGNAHGSLCVVPVIFSN